MKPGVNDAVNKFSFTIVGIRYISSTEQEGFLATSFNLVNVNGVFDYERLPDSRSRVSYSARHLYALKRDSFLFGASYYDDDWGISAQTYEFRFNFNLDDGSKTFQPWFRYYEQSRADYFALNFEEQLEFQTTDPDLGDLTGYHIGFNNSFSSSNFFSWNKKATYDIGFSYYKRSDDLDFYWLTIGWSLE